MTDVSQLMTELDKAAAGLDKASTRLYEAIKEFEGDFDAEGIWQPGPQLLYEEKIADEAALIYTTAVEDPLVGKPPPEAIREARAIQKVKALYPDIYSDYHRLKSEIGSLQQWMAAKKQAISARQSVLSTEKKLHLEGTYTGGQR